MFSCFQLNCRFVFDVNSYSIVIYFSILPIFLATETAMFRNNKTIREKFLFFSRWTHEGQPLHGWDPASHAVPDPAGRKVSSNISNQCSAIFFHEYAWSIDSTRINSSSGLLQYTMFHKSCHMNWKIKFVLMEWPIFNIKVANERVNYFKNIVRRKFANNFSK